MTAADGDVSLHAEAVIYVRDLARMAAFYEQCLGFTVVLSEATYVQLRSEVWTLMLVAVPAEVAATITLASPPRRRADAAIKLAFVVASIDTVAARLSDMGGQLDPAQTRWSFAGFIRCDALDPEGNVIQLRQRCPGGAAPVRDPRSD